MYLRLSPNTDDSAELKISEEENGTKIDIKGCNSSHWIEVDNFVGVTIRDSPSFNACSENFDFFVPCKFAELNLNCNSKKVMLCGISCSNYSVKINGSRNHVIFADNQDLACVSWEENGTDNVLDLSQQRNTCTSGKFGPTTDIVTNKTRLPLCRICYGDSNVLLIPCGHLGICKSCCSSTFSQNSMRCPFCRQTVSTVQALFIA